MTINKKCPYSGMPVNPEHSFMFIGHCSAGHKRKTMKIMGIGVAVLVGVFLVFGQG